MATKLYTYPEIALHNKVEDAWIVIDSKVYDITNFLDEHPGGDEIILDMAGGDATENFLDIGHSDDALKILKKKCIGDMDPESKPVKKQVDSSVANKTNNKSQGSGSLALIVAIVCFIIGYYILNE